MATSKYPDQIFVIDTLQNNKNREDYMKVLIYFAPLLYKELLVFQKFKTELLSDVLTCSDEVFILLCIIVYYCDYSDTTIREDYGDKKFVLKTGWQEHGIELYNWLYQDVKADCNEFGEEFDNEFQTFYTARTQDTEIEKRRRKEKRNLPQAMNDL